VIRVVESSLVVISLVTMVEGNELLLRREDESCETDSLAEDRELSAMVIGSCPGCGEWETDESRLATAESAAIDVERDGESRKEVESMPVDSSVAGPEEPGAGLSECGVTGGGVDDEGSAVSGISQLEEQVSGREEG
jgi:hypothetical protein